MISTEEERSLNTLVGNSQRSIFMLAIALVVPTLLYRQVGGNLTTDSDRGRVVLDLCFGNFIRVGMSSLSESNAPSTPSAIRFPEECTGSVAELLRANSQSPYLSRWVLTKLEISRALPVKRNKRKQRKEPFVRHCLARSTRIETLLTSVSRNSVAWRKRKKRKPPNE